MAQVKVRLVRPLDGHKEGAIRTFDSGDAERLASFGAVTILGPAKSPALKARNAPTKDVKASPAQRRGKVAKG